VTHEPKLGRPKIIDPVFIINWPGAWLNSVGDHRFDDRDVVDNLLKCGRSSETSAPDCPYSRKLELRPEQLRIWIDEGGTIPPSAARLAASVPSNFVKYRPYCRKSSIWLGPPAIEKIDHILRLRREVGLLRGKRIDGPCASPLLAQKMIERQRPPSRHHTAR
jgi:hypothetical protein